MGHGRKNKTQPLGWVCLSNNPASKFDNVTGLRALLALHDLKLYLVTLLQAFIAFGTDGAVMDENIRSVVATDEPEAFGVVKPLYCSFNTSHLRFLRTRHLRVQARYPNAGPRRPEFRERKSYS